MVCDDCPHSMDVTGGKSPMLTRLILIRHCEEFSGLGSWPRLADVHHWQETEGVRSLSPSGREQAAALARVIAEREPDALLTSPLPRATETAAAIAVTTGLAVGIEPLLAEVTFGHLPGFGPAGIHGILEGTLGRLRLPRGFWLSMMRGMWLMGATGGVDSPAAVADRAAILRKRLEAADGVGSSAPTTTLASLPGQRRVERRGMETLAVVSHGVILLYLLANLLEVHRLPALRRKLLLRTGEFRVLEAWEGSWRQTSRGRAQPDRRPKRSTSR